MYRVTTFLFADPSTNRSTSLVDRVLCLGDAGQRRPGLRRCERRLPLPAGRLCTHEVPGGRRGLHCLQGRFRPAGPQLQAAPLLRRLTRLRLREQDAVRGLHPLRGSGHAGEAAGVPHGVQNGGGEGLPVLPAGGRAEVFQGGLEFYFHTEWQQVGSGEMCLSYCDYNATPPSASR